VGLRRASAKGRNRLRLSSVRSDVFFHRRDRTQLFAAFLSGPSFRARQIVYPGPRNAGVERKTNSAAVSLNSHKPNAQVDLSWGEVSGHAGRGPVDELYFTLPTTTKAARRHPAKSLFLGFVRILSVSSLRSGPDFTRFLSARWLGRRGIPQRRPY
jgi:hypothetical protein